MWISERSFSMLHIVSDILGCRLLGSPICGFFSYTSFILFRASLKDTNKTWHGRLVTLSSSQAIKVTNRNTSTLIKMGQVRTDYNYFLDFSGWVMMVCDGTGNLFGGLTSDPSLSGALCWAHRSSAAASSSSVRGVSGWNPPEMGPGGKKTKNKWTHILNYLYILNEASDVEEWSWENTTGEIEIHLDVLKCCLSFLHLLTHYPQNETSQIQTQISM